MKYLKKFEDKNITRKEYWLIATDDRFEESLKEIGISNYYHSSILNNKILHEMEYIYMTKNLGYMSILNRYDGSDYFDKKGYKYMGRINVSEEELDAKKYNL